jgi:hypothetical protein
MNKLIKIATTLPATKNLLEILLMGSKTSYTINYDQNEFNISFDDAKLSLVLDNLLSSEFEQIKDIVYLGIIRYYKEIK